MLPLDVYLQNEDQMVMSTTTGEIVDGLSGTLNEKLLRNDQKARVVVNFHGVSVFFPLNLNSYPSVFFIRLYPFFPFSGKSVLVWFNCQKLFLLVPSKRLLPTISDPLQNAGHLGQGWRPSTYRSISGIPHTHLVTCDYRGFGLSTLNNAPYLPTETGLITDAVSLLSYVETDLKHPSTRTVILGQSLGTAVTAASALYFADPSSAHLPTDLTHVSPLPKSHPGFAGIVLVAPFRDLATLMETYKIGGFVPILRPLRGYTRIANFLLGRIVDNWPTLSRLRAFISATATEGSPIRLTLLHSRNDQDIDFRQSEALFQPLQSTMLGEEGVSAREERRSIHGSDRVKRGAFAYKRVEDGRGERVVELEVVRYGGHNEVVGWTQVSLALRRAFEAAETRQERRVGLDVE